MSNKFSKLKIKTLEQHKATIEEEKLIQKIEKELNSTIAHGVRTNQDVVLFPTFTKSYSLSVAEISQLRACLVHNGYLCGDDREANNIVINLNKPHN